MGLERLQVLIESKLHRVSGAPAVCFAERVLHERVAVTHQVDGHKPLL
jgi:hypothetical protein